MKKWKTIVLLLILSISALVANSIHLQSEMTFNSSAAASSSSVNWSNFRGAVYRWQNLSLYPDQPFAPNPDIWFATMKNLGFNYARVGDLDWNYMMTNPTKYDALLQDVANAADANGFSVTYIFGGGDLRVYDQAFFTPDGGPYCQGSASCYSNFTADFFNNNLSLYPNGLYNGQTVWQIMFDSFIKELIQQLDGHASTVGYEIINEPHATSSQLHNYYEFELTQMRTMTTKALVLQGNAGGVGSVQDFPSSNLAPFVYEIHNYQGVLNYNPYPQTAQNCKNAGCSGVVLGEWHFNPTGYISPYTSLNEEITDELNAVKANGMANTWFSATCHSSSPELLDNNCNPTSEATLLSQLDTQILGQPSYGSTSNVSTSSSTSTFQTSTTLPTGTSSISTSMSTTSTSANTISQSSTSSTTLSSESSHQSTSSNVFSNAFSLGLLDYALIAAVILIIGVVLLVVRRGSSSTKAR